MQIKSQAKISFRSALAQVVIVTLALVGLNFTPVMSAAPASAATVDMTSQSLTFNRSIANSITCFKYNNAACTANNVTASSGDAWGTKNGDVVRYNNVGTVGGIKIDAVVTTTLVNGATLGSKIDAPGSASSTAAFFQPDVTVTSATSYASFNFSFYESGSYSGPNTGVPVVLKNVTVTSIDLDSVATGDYQYTDVSGYQNYVLSSDTHLRVTQPAGTNLTRFGATTGNGSSIPQDQVQLKFSSMNTFDVRFGNAISATGYYGLNFGSPSWGTTTPVEKNNPYNSPPTSTDTTKNFASGVPTILNRADFGSYSDPDANPFNAVKITQLPTIGSLEFNNGNGWMPVALNQDILTADIDLGKLRFTGTANTNLQFKVFDALAYAANANTLTLNRTNNTQAITFAPISNQTPTASAFSPPKSADSGLPVTLTSSTLGICTVDANGLVTLTGVSGLCILTASQNGNSTYAAASPVTQSFMVSALASQSITFANPGTKLLSGGNYTIPVTTSSTPAALPVTFTSYTPLICTVSGAVITFVSAGYCEVKATQDGNTTYAAATPVSQIFQITTPTTETITYDPNGGSSGPGIQSFTSGSTVTLSTTAPVRTGYTFAGWATNSAGSGTKYSAGANAGTQNSSLVLYATWTPLNYTVTYMSTGATSGSAPTQQSFTVASGAVISASNGGGGSLAKSGYVFSGWNSAANLSGATYSAGETYSAAANLTLYPIWTALASHSVIYDANQGTGNAPAPQSFTTSAVIEAGGATLVRTGYKFEGWNTAADGSGNSYAAGDVYAIAANLKLYAVWSAINYELLFDRNGGEGTAPARAAFTVANFPHIGSSTLNRSGYAFMGWATNAAGTGTVWSTGDLWDIARNQTLYAVWRAETYTVTYEVNGASTSAPAKQEFTVESAATISATVMVRDGYKFEGWNTQPDSTGNAYVSGDLYRLPADIVLYPSWTPKMYDVVYEANGGTGTIAPRQVITIASGAYIADIVEYLDPSSPQTSQIVRQVTRAGYTFGGWNTRADGTGTQYAAGAFYGPTPNVTFTGITLYAHWIPLNYHVHYLNTGADAGTDAEPGDQVFTVESPAVISSSNMLKAGYTFGGWISTQGSLPVGFHYSTPGDVTLTPDWIPNASHQVSYVANGGTGTIPDPQNALDGQNITIAAGTGVSRAGFRFGGWATTSNAHTANYQPGSTYSAAASVELYAVWTPITYTLAYNLNGGTGTTPATQSFDVLTGAVVENASPTKVGYRFDGWWSSAQDGNSGVTLLVGDKYEDPASLTLYAVWTPINYTLNYDANGGTGKTPDDEVFTYKDGVVIANGSDNLTRPGYIFDGWWNTAANGSGAQTYVAGDLYKKAADITLYALWKPVKYTVEYEKNGGTGTVQGKQDFTVATPAKISSSTLTRNGYSFLGWNTASDGTGSTYRADDMYAEPSSMVLYATWIPIEYTVGYDSNGATGGATPPDASFTVENGAVIGANAPVGSPLTKTGYRFDGWWNSQANGQGTQTFVTGDTYRDAADITLYAIWVPNGRYTVSYSENGGTGGAPTTQTFQSGGTVKIEPKGTMVRPGYSFSGWSTAAGSGGTQYATGSNYSTDANLVLYATWTPNTYTLKYSLNGASGSRPSEATFTPESRPTVSSATPSRPGYVFSGWNTAANGKGDDFRSDDVFGLNANVTLYAMWDAVDYLVVYDANSANGVAPKDTKFNVATPVKISSDAGLTLPGHKFAGWNTAADGSGTSYKVGVSYSSPVNLVLYAQWAVSTQPSVSLPKYDEKFFFYGDSSKMLPSSTPALATFARTLVRTTSRTSVTPTIVIKGYVLETANKSYDMRLSLSRARAVEQQLIADGVRGKFSTVAVGIHQAADASARRVEVVVDYNK